MGACLLVFVSQWPVLSRQAYLDPSVPLDARMGGALMAWLFIVPLAAYVMAAASHLLAKVGGGRGTWFGARLALFWALLAASPLWLLNGLVAGFIGPGPALNLVGVIAWGVPRVLGRGALGSGTRKRRADGMTLTLNGLLGMVWRTVRNPREGATEVLSLGVPREALWPALALVVVLSILFAQPPRFS
jgi:hypothetical protein